MDSLLCCCTWMTSDRLLRMRAMWGLQVSEDGTGLLCVEAFGHWAILKCSCPMICIERGIEVLLECIPRYHVSAAN